MVAMEDLLIPYSMSFCCVVCYLDSEELDGDITTFPSIKEKGKDYLVPGKSSCSSTTQPNEDTCRRVTGCQAQGGRTSRKDTLISLILRLASKVQLLVHNFQQLGRLVKILFSPRVNVRNLLLRHPAWCCKYLLRSIAAIPHFWFFQ